MRLFDIGKTPVVESSFTKERSITSQAQYSHFPCVAIELQARSVQVSEMLSPKVNQGFKSVIFFLVEFSLHSSVKKTVCIRMAKKVDTTFDALFCGRIIVVLSLRMATKLR